MFHCRRFVIVTLALTAGATPIALADPPPLVRAEAAIRAENRGPPFVAWSDRPPLARAEAAIAAENAGDSPSRRGDLRRAAAIGLAHRVTSLPTRIGGRA
jgi:hypothetical protein